MKEESIISFMKSGMLTWYESDIGYSSNFSFWRIDFYSETNEVHCVDLLNKKEYSEIALTLGDLLKS